MTENAKVGALAWLGIAVGIFVLWTALGLLLWLGIRKPWRS